MYYESRIPNIIYGEDRFSWTREYFKGDRGAKIENHQYIMVSHDFNMVDGGKS